MSWLHKERAHLPMPETLTGLWYLDGDMVAAKYGMEHLAGNTRPMLAFPSGLKRELLSVDDTFHILVHGRLTVPIMANLPDTYFHIEAQAQQDDYRLGEISLSGFSVWRQGLGGRYRLSFDESQEHLDNVSYVPGEPGSHRAPRSMELLDGMSRAVLPQLYSQEMQGLEAIATVKFFTPDSGWTWYASEFDGEDLFFGLVSGFEVELGYFSLAEIEGVRGGLGLAVERDLYYQPQSLQEIKAHEQQLKGR